MPGSGTALRAVVRGVDAVTASSCIIIIAAEKVFGMRTNIVRGIPYYSAHNSVNSPVHNYSNPVGLIVNDAIAICLF